MCDIRCCDNNQPTYCASWLLENSTANHIVVLLQDAAPGEFVAGDRITHGDLAIFVLASQLSSGIMDGVPKDILKDYPKVQAFRQKIANLDKVKAFYAEATDDMRQAFKP
eukprot:jgi/Chrzof1/13373/Cz07g30180.t1